MGCVAGGGDHEISGLLCERNGAARHRRGRPRVQHGYVSSGTSGHERSLRELKNRSVSSENVPARAPSGRTSPTHPSLVMKGSAVRVRASAYPDLQGSLCDGNSCRSLPGYETGTSLDTFTHGVVVRAAARLMAICRYFEAWRVRGG